MIGFVIYILSNTVYIIEHSKVFVVDFFFTLSHYVRDEYKCIYKEVITNNL